MWSLNLFTFGFNLIHLKWKKWKVSDFTGANKHDIFKPIFVTPLMKKIIKQFFVLFWLFKTIIYFLRGIVFHDLWHLMTDVLPSFVLRKRPPSFFLCLICLSFDIFVCFSPSTSFVSSKRITSFFPFYMSVCLSVCLSSLLSLYSTVFICQDKKLFSFYLSLVCTLYLSVLPLVFFCLLAAAVLSFCVRLCVFFWVWGHLLSYTLLVLSYAIKSA